MEDLGIAVHAVGLEQHDPGDLAVVVGAGPIGILAAQTLVAHGVNVIVTDRAEPRLELAEAISGGTVVNVEREDYQEKVDQMSNGRGADFVLEAAAGYERFNTATRVGSAGGDLESVRFRRPQAGGNDWALVLGARSSPGPG